VKSLGCYDVVETYDNVGSIPQMQAMLFDVAGNGALRSSIHHVLGDNVVHSARVGLAHWNVEHDNDRLPGAQPTQFFSPEALVHFQKEWGKEEVERRFAKTMSDAFAVLDRWISLSIGHGQAAVESVYRETLAGRALPQVGHFLSNHNS
jgi:hypothetical protein